WGILSPTMTPRWPPCGARPIPNHPRPNPREARVFPLHGPSSPDSVETARGLCICLDYGGGRFGTMPLVRALLCLPLVPVLLAVCLAAAPASAPTPGNPRAHLPANIEILTHFGERADISPDNQRIAFMAKSFGDAMMIDLQSRDIRCLTCNVPGAVFLRVMHLMTGDYLLIGPDHFENT